MIRSSKTASMSRPWKAAAAWLIVVGAMAGALAGCANKPHRAPVEERTPVPYTPAADAASVPAASSDAVKLLPGAENAGKPGYYTVKPGDTLIRIGLDNGQNWRDLVRWNGLDNPNVIEVGQVVRVVPPGVDPGAAASRPVTTARIETRPLDSHPAGSAPPPVQAASAPASAVGSASAGAGTAVATISPSTASAAVSPSASSAPAPAAVAGGDDDVKWSWPAAGPLVGSFDESKVKGLDVGGKAGDPVYAAADGRVVYVGSALRGYGNLIILKHNQTYLTAYAHNQTLLVKDDQVVRRGQKIAEMGSSDSDSVKLHFEIRKQGKPIDPARLLPPR